MNRECAPECMGGRWYEINLLYIVALVALGLTGPGALSIDAWWQSRGKRRRTARAGARLR